MTESLTNYYDGMERDKGQIKEYAAMLLSDLIKGRLDKNLHPHAVEMVDLQNALIADAKAVLNELCEEKVLTFHRTLNGVSFEFTPPK